MGGQRIAVTFSDGETGDDAKTFRATFRWLVEQADGALGHPGGGCLERSPLN
jgi:hypothetical protein